MGKLIYSVITSLDGRIADERGDYDWAEPDEQVHAYVNDLERSVGTYLLGRRMYDEMAVWDTLPLHDQPQVMRDFAEMWRVAGKIVYSTALEAVRTRRTRIHRSFEPDAVRTMKDAAEHDLAIGGADIAAEAFRNGLVDECSLFVAPVVVGGGKRVLPDGVRLHLDLLDQRRFDSGFVHLRYRVGA